MPIRRFHNLGTPKIAANETDPWYIQPVMHLPSLRDDLLDVVRYLVKDIGPRRATSLAEAQAAAYVDGRLRRAGMRVSADTFRAAVHINPLYGIVPLLGVVAALLTCWFPLPSLLLALWGIGLTVGNALVPPPPFPAFRRDSQNIVGTRASEKMPRWRVVLIAPLDSVPKRTGLSQFVGAQRIAVLGQVTAFGLVALLALLQLLRPTDTWWYGLILPAVYLLLSVLFLRQDVGASPGGAGALAVLVSVAERLHPLRYVELWTVALGATATGNAGLYNLLDRYPFPRQETCVIALELLDSGQLTYASREGVLQQHTPDPLLARFAATADANDPLINIEPRPYRDAPSIAAALYTRGYRVLTVLTHQDMIDDLVPDNEMAGFDPQVLDRATRLIMGIVRQLDDEYLVTDA